MLHVKKKHLFSHVRYFTSSQDQIDGAVICITLVILTLHR